jgi:hypothetical protein
MTVEENDVGAIRVMLEDLLDGRIPTRIDARTPISYEALANGRDRLLRDSTKGDMPPRRLDGTHQQ